MGWKNFEMLDVALVGEWDKEIWWSIIEQADVIQVGGGNSGYLSYWLQKSGVFDALPELLKHKVYVGISAGSMMATAGLNVSSGALTNELEPYEFPLNDPTVPACQVSRLTLGFTDFLFRPHWNAGGRFKGVTEETLRKAYQSLGKSIYLVDDETGLKIVNGHVSVASEGKWLLIDAKK
jgi:dipeptidase E